MFYLLSHVHAELCTPRYLFIHLLAWMHRVWYGTGMHLNGISGAVAECLERQEIANVPGTKCTEADKKWWTTDFTV